MNVNMLNILQFGLLLLGTGLPGALASPQIRRPNDVGSSDSGSVVTITPNQGENEPIEMRVSRDGSLAYKDLEQPMVIWESTVVSDVRAKCFYWREMTGTNYVPWSASNLFSLGSSQIMPEAVDEDPYFEGAERPYCYDATADEDADGSTFTLFLDSGVPARGSSSSVSSEREVGLIKVRIGHDADFAEAPLREAVRGQVSGSVSAKMVEAPRRGGSSYFPTAMEPQFDPTGEADGEEEVDYNDDVPREPRAGCYFLSEGNEGLMNTRSVFMEFGDMMPIGNLGEYERIVCFRDVFDQRQRRTWTELDSRRQNM